MRPIVATRRIGPAVAISLVLLCPATPTACVAETSPRLKTLDGHFPFVVPPTPDGWPGGRRGCVAASRWRSVCIRCLRGRRSIRESATPGRTG